MSGSRNSENILLTIYRDTRTVFRLIDVALLTGETNRLSLGKRLHYYVKKGELLNLRKGIYAKPGYNPEELACRIYTPSYISFDYVLRQAGVIFQYDARITVASYLSRHIDADVLSIRYRKLKGALLVNNAGLEKPSPHVTRAIPERAFLDLLYLDPDVWFDNPDLLDKKRISALLSLYLSDALTRRVKNFL